MFVRDGLIVPAGSAAGRELPGGRTLVERAWSAGERVEIGARVAVAPQVAECVTLFSIPLGDVSRLVSMGGAAPDTALAFSPDGGRLAVGSFTGELLVVDAWTGEELARRAFPEAVVKRLAWSPDGEALWIGEQSPDALVHLVESGSLRTTATARLADHVGSSAPPPGDDLFGVYTLPGPYGLEVLPSGDAIVAATHGWNDPDGVRRNRARVLRLDGRTLEVRAAWPAGGPADAVLLAMDVSSEEGGVGAGRVAVSVARSAAGPPPEGVPVGGVQLLDLELVPEGEVRFEPLRPWFDSVYIWDALDLSPRGDLAVGLGDGRVAVRGADPALGLSWDHPLGAPVLAGDVPIVASVGHVAWAGDGNRATRAASPAGEVNELIAVSSRTNIPYGAASPELRPPRAHPQENAIFALRPGAEAPLRWTWSGPHTLQGLTIAPGGGWAVVGAGARDSDHREDLFGALVFDLRGEGSGTSRLRAQCATAGPVFFRQALTGDGRIAVAEVPWRAGDAVRGVYRVTVLR